MRGLDIRPNMRGLDICAGSGIGSAVWKCLGGTTVCYVENDPYCQKLLQARMRDGVICDAPIWDDLRTFRGEEWRSLVDFMFGGIPCTPYSAAGRRTGPADERDLWNDFRRVLGEVRPRYALLENVPSRQLSERIATDLAADGYDVEWTVISAAPFVDQKDGRRLWALVSPMCEGLERIHSQGGGVPLQPTQGPISRYLGEARPRVHRRGDGMAQRVQRTRTVGNG